MHMLLSHADKPQIFKMCLPISVWLSSKHVPVGLRSNAVIHAYIWEIQCFNSASLLFKIGCHQMHVLRKRSWVWTNLQSVIIYHAVNGCYNAVLMSWDSASFLPSFCAPSLVWYCYKLKLNLSRTYLHVMNWHIKSNIPASCKVLF